MIGHFKIAIVCSLLLILAIPASAEFYQYVDTNGITHFTDNVLTIPTEYRSQLERHPEIVTIPEENPYAEYTAADSSDTDFTEEEPFMLEPETAPVEEGIDISSEKIAKPSGITKLVAERKILQDKKEALNKKFEMLMAEKQQIENSKGDMKDEASAAQYNERVREMNVKIQQYKEEEKRFKLELDKFNASIKPPETE
ncbi:MAG: DUF4124 domain-containing protein [Desulfobacteraceae bacterium]|nr:DUF4124 domain-containing protein [Desulfobacteraceae bacterium]MBC2754895.1 DUF4124 domain-containing protein [Desulfobacteraceae bacterium]